MITDDKSHEPHTEGILTVIHNGLQGKYEENLDSCQFDFKPKFGTREAVLAINILL